MWQDLASEGRLEIADRATINDKRREIESALSDLCLDIAVQAGDINLTGIARAKALRSKPAAGGKSSYECLNQLLHYWYCCAGASFLLDSGFGNLVMRPTGHDNMNEGHLSAYDLEAKHPEYGDLVGEVFCVSRALWRQKIDATRGKLATSDADIQVIFYNAEAKPAYVPKSTWPAIFTIDVSGPVVRRLHCPHPVLWPAESEGQPRGPLATGS